MDREGALAMITKELLSGRPLTLRNADGVIVIRAEVLKDSVIDVRW
jgi:hypothetical protein